MSGFVDGDEAVMYGLEPTQLLEDKRLSPINDHLTRGLLAVSSRRLAAHLQSHLKKKKTFHIFPAVVVFVTRFHA